MSKRVAVIFTDEEYAQVKEIVGLVPMSAWLRALALYKTNESVQRMPARNVGTEARIKADVPMHDEDRETDKRRVCAHGVKKGYRCWQCSGPAIILKGAEMSYQDNNAVESVSAEQPTDSRALNPPNIVHLDSADTSPNEPKQFVVDDFLCTTYSPGTNTDERPNMSGLYGKGRGV